MRTKSILSAVTLAALVAASFSTVSNAQSGNEGGNGPRMFVFEEMDANGDGKVTKDEVAAFHAAQLAAMDTDKDGNLSAAELIAAQQKRQAEREADRETRMAERMIEQRDANKDGVLSLEEMAPKGDRGDKMFDRADTDGDGAISKAEADAMKAKMEKRGDRGRGDDDHGHKGKKGKHGDDDHGHKGKKGKHHPMPGDDDPQDDQDNG
ncbi:EF-hand domain-containing protein [Pseudorhodobacter wandonensis]|uniref:EF-hand domain-containing protein n=1 Tax=Pseudorhodobacter wandonensis TaxID=1120568 RepID=UPI00067D0E83|nr:EF-hand domain-containing protein [Pseudorhodobacter wandonensis]